MSESKKMEAGEQLRKHHRNTKSKEGKIRLGGFKRGPFLTDTQTSDYTKSSGQMNILKIEYLEETIKELRIENNQLKQTIVDMKANQFFQINEEKLKEFIKQTERLRNELQVCKNQLEQSLIQRDFLARFNKNLKAQCENITKQLLYLKKHGPETKKIDRTSGYNSSSEDLSRLPYRSCSTQVILTRRRDKKKTENQNHLKTTRNTTSTNQLNQQYFVGKSKSKYKILRTSNCNTSKI